MIFAGPELIQLILAPKSHQGRKSKGENDRARRKKGGGEKQKTVVALLVFIMATMMAYFGLKKLKLSCRQNHSLGSGPWFGCIEYILN